MRLFILILLFLAIPSTGRAMAGYCEGVQSSADIITCLNKRLEDAQEKLNEIYTALNDSYDEEGRKSLQHIQRAWLVYRDLECGWQRREQKTESLKRIQELSCLTFLTEKRHKILSTQIKKEENETISEFDAYPRWMNVLAHENTDVYWRYGEHLRGDFDCDGHDERAMIGIGFEEPKEESGQPETSLFLAVVENPVTGKPHIDIFNIAITEQVERAGVCNPDVKMTLIDHPLLSVRKTETEEKETKTECKIALRLDDKKCRPLTFYWSGENYQFNPALPESE